ncbi:MAG: hypothetical protein WC967_08525 [Balneolaceae bacterium]
MPLLRWIHKSWNVFWISFGILGLTVFIIGLLGFGILQLKATKTYIATRIEQNFNSKYKGVLTIGKLSGIMPMSFDLEEVNLYPDSSSVKPVFHAENLSASLDLFALLRQEFIVTGLNLNTPTIIIDSENRTEFLAAITKKEQILIEEPDEIDAPFFEILAPSVTVRSGTVILRNVFDKPQAFTSSDSLTFKDINLAMFFEYKAVQRFLDIDNLTMSIPELDIDNAQMYGQVYNNDRFLEFNSFNFNTNDALLKLSGRADGVDLFKENISKQLKAATLSLDIEEAIVSPERVRQFYPELITLEKPILAALTIEGTLDLLYLDDLTFQYGNSGFRASGNFRDLLNSEKFSYKLALKETTLDRNDLEPLFENSSEAQLNTITSLVIDANISGTLKKIAGELNSFSDRGGISINGELGLKESNRLDINFKTDSLDIGGLFAGNVSTSSITSTGSIKLNDYNHLDTVEEMNIIVRKSSLNESKIDIFNLNASSKNDVLYPIFTLIANGSSINGNGSIDLRDDIKRFKISGSGSNVDLKQLTQMDQLAAAFADIEYEADISASTLDDAFGKISVEFPRTVIEGDTLAPHLFYADLSNKPNGGKIFRFTSTALDVTLDGDYYTSQLGEITQYWREFFANRLSTEITFEAPFATLDKAATFVNQEFDLTAQIKNYDIVKSYLPELPSIVSTARITSSISANKDRLLFNLDWYDNHVVFEDNEADTVRAQITGSFRHNERIKDFSVFELKANAKRLETKHLNAEGFELIASLNRDSIHVTQKIDRIGTDVTYNMEGNIHLEDKAITMRIDEFKLGSDIYNWVNRRVPTVIYTNAKQWIVEDLTFESEQQFVSVDGVYSENLTDSMNYRIRGVDLGKISDLIKGDIPFSGNLNGTFITRTLSSIPSFEGVIDLKDFAISNNIVGNLQVASNFNQPLNRFDTNISIQTDPKIFPDYYVNNDRKGQDIEIDGYILAPEEGGFSAEDTLFNFDVGMHSLDLWFIPYLTPSVFHAMEGKAKGTGKLWGNLETYDFFLNFGIGLDDAVYIKPNFLETYYYAQGPVTFSRKKGLVFDDIFLIDPSGGTAVLDGYYNFNDFSGVDSMDIRLNTKDFQLLNSTFDSESPFYGKAYGTGLIRMFGTSINPTIETSTPVVLSSFSDIGLPLLEETEFDTDNKFIRFVDSFDSPTTDSTSSRTNSVFSNNKVVDASTLTFVERFTLDLQFIANDPMTVRLIFDPVTGDIIKSDGTGRLRIRLQDQDLSIFGRFDITGGSYQFVSGDIFTRRFSLESGGSIVWEGDPANARINLNAVFSARPDIQTLTTTRADRDPNTAQRVPVDLVLNINGNFSSIQNDFYFRLPNTFESLQSTTLATQINALNQNEEEKLLQATSFLLLENFIPSKASLGGAGTLTDNLSTNAGAAVLNPLISSQVISPLLSNQINSLLRSDLSTLDVDFSLNTYNQIDLGVALRLYNDKIILRRDGQITGAQSNIGDLGATYRINRVFSVSAFHRQDPTFSGIEQGQQTQQAQDINGLGIEAVYGFDSWNDFFRKLAIPFKRIFGIRDDVETNTDQTEEPVS